MKASKLVKEVIEATLFAGLLSAGITFVSLALWAWATIIYPPLDTWMAIKCTFGIAMAASTLYAYADIGDRW